MKLTTLAFIFAAAFFAVARGQAQIGDDYQALVARWGQPENPLTLIVGVGQWDLKNGVKVVALLTEGRTQFLIWLGIDAKLAATLLNRNLPPGTTWVDGKDLKDWTRDWIKKYVSDVATSNLGEPGVAFQQTSDGKLWCKYSVDSFLVGTPQGFERMARLAIALSNTEKEP
jgi:hypothetical protein